MQYQKNGDFSKNKTQIVKLIIKLYTNEWIAAEQRNVYSLKKPAALQAPAGCYVWFIILQIISYFQFFVFQHPVLKLNLVKIIII
jgi:hypothetical protein